MQDHGQQDPLCSCRWTNNQVQRILRSGGEVNPINSLKPKSQADRCSMHAAPAALSPGLRSLPLSLPGTGSPPEVAQVAPGHQPPPHPQGGVLSSKPVGQNAGGSPRTRRVGCHPTPYPWKVAG